MNLTFCPDCGGELDLIVGGSIVESYPPGYIFTTEISRVYERPAPFLACQSCEYCVETVPSVITIPQGGHIWQ